MLGRLLMAMLTMCVGFRVPLLIFHPKHIFGSCLYMVYDLVSAIQTK